ncbi:hypothetical protein MC378_12495 [Polaribacter sp. MSW13]|uniref:TonB-dependent receptor plug domain-containing protein n=1 Tax=Polaribacter marinus TaxID=2916838 RepID=A0A9X1VNU5_9FLAO|nr:hypothetical protein [Polaribacter marinus]MCI2229989.1 hypothetical protein [Polaribacter marinus]
MIEILPNKKFTVTLYCLIFSIFLSFGQSSANQNIDSIIYKNTQQNYKETVYSHLNKSIYIKGEEMGFTSYVINKKTKKPSLLTTNLYAVITDKDDTVIKEKLFKVENGIASGSFLLDSLFTTGIYKVKTYTNWMLNFKEQNYFVGTIKVIDSNKPLKNNNIIENDEIDIQFLPESGTFLSNINNTIGIIAKDTLGYGIPNISGEILENNSVIRKFQLNNLGIGRASFTPKKGSFYSAIINFNGKKITKTINTHTKEKGILIKLSKTKKEVFVALATNKNTLSKIKKKNYFLVFQNKGELNKLKIQFQNNTTIIQRINLNDLAYGINIFTLIDEMNNPIAERMFFNYKGLPILNFNQSSIKKVKDSLKVSFKFDNKNNFKNNNISVSILPKETKSYNKNSNIISQTLLTPYLKGVVENGSYYFKNINNQKEYDIDNLLITQGWSSFDWKEVRTENKKQIHQFEKGISIKVNIPNIEKESHYLIHHLSNRNGNILSFQEEVKSFQLYSYFPMDNENLFISKIGKKNKLVEPSLYVQYFPNHIPKLNTSTRKFLIPKNLYNTSEKEIENYYPNFYALNSSNTLDEVIIKTNLKEQRIEKIKNQSMGRVHFLNDFDRNSTLANFIGFKPGIFAYDDFNTGEIVAINRAQNSPIAFFLDGFLVPDKRMLFYYNLYDVEYIDINLRDMSGGLAYGTGGVIRIKTDPLLNVKNKKTVRKLKFPITFSSAKKFYVPKYKNYQNSFYKNYGVIDWLPKNKITEDGILNVVFKNNKQNYVSLFVEGITTDGKFISKEITVDTE